METTELTVHLREGAGKGGARKVRAQGKIPGIIYGKGTQNILVSVDLKDMNLALSRKSGMNTLLEMSVPKHGKITAMLKDYQADNLTRSFTHLDFVTVDLQQKIRVEIPIQVVGKSEGVKEGGVLELIRRELEVICLPTRIPQNIEVDVSALKIGQSIHRNELKLPEGVEIISDQNFTVVSVVAPKEEEVVVAAPVEGAPTEPEVITAKKPVEGEAAPDKKAEGKPEKK